MTAKALDQELLEQLIFGALGRHPGTAEAPKPVKEGQQALSSSVLIVADHDHVAQDVESALGTWGGRRTVVRSAHAALAAVKVQSFDLVLCSLKMEGCEGPRLVQELIAANPEGVVIGLVGQGMFETGMAALSAGAVDLLAQPCSQALLELKARKALEYSRTLSSLRRGQTLARALDRQMNPPTEWIARAESMRRLSTVVERAAQSDSTVLIQGEAHTGKSLLARKIHELSSRGQKAFLRLDCTLADERGLASMLFGEEPNTPSFFELADGGTLFLDEVGALPGAIQEKLMKTLQERSVSREGGTRKRAFDVRLIASSSKDLRAETDEGRFRKDLYYRLHVVPVAMPPLRERGEDIPALAQLFAERAAKRRGDPMPSLSPAVIEALQQHAWPGNLGELELVIDRAVSTSGGGLEAVASATPTLQVAGATSPVVPQTYGTLTETVEALERQLIGEAYEKTRRVKTETARILGIKTSTLYYKLEKYGFITSGEGQE